MENVLNFLADYYLYFMIGAVVLLFALIGFAVQGRKKKQEDVNPMTPLNNAAPNVPLNPTTPDANAQMANNVQPNAMLDMNNIQNNTLAGVQNPSTPITNNESMESLTLEPASGEPEMLDLTPASNEPSMETLDLGAIPVSMEPEQSVMQTAPEVPTMAAQPTEPVAQGYNNTIQQ